MGKKRILITGANKARGIGIETLRLFLQAEYEAVVITRDFSKFEFIDNPNVKAISYNLNNLNGISGLVKQIGHVDVLVNNSGLNNFTHYSEYRQEQLSEILNVNLLAPYELIRAVIYLWKKENNSYGRIVNVSSEAAEHGNKDVWYGATKAALSNITKSFYLLEKKNGLIINAVEPGVIDSNWYKDVPWRKEIVENAKNNNQVIQPESVAETIFWLGTSSPEGINGSIIPVQAGK